MASNEKRERVEKMVIELFKVHYPNHPYPGPDATPREFGDPYDFYYALVETFDLDNPSARRRYEPRQLEGRLGNTIDNITKYWNGKLREEESDP